MKEIQIEFGRRLCLWSLNDWNREIQGDFPLLRLIKSPNAEGALHIIQTLHPDQIVTFVRALVRRFWSQRNLPMDEPFNEREKQLVDWYLQSGRKYRWDLASRIPAGGI